MWVQKTAMKDRKYGSIVVVAVFYSGIGLFKHCTETV
jgi:hypothetical protein